MLLCDFAPISLLSSISVAPSLSASPSVSLHFLREKLDIGQSAFWSWHGKQKQRRTKKASIHSPIILYSWSPMCFYYLNYSPSTESFSLIVKPSYEELFPQRQKKSYLWNTDYLKRDRRVFMEGNTRFHRLPCPTSGLWTCILALCSLVLQ